MLQFFSRFLLVVAGAITSWFVARDALNFPIIQMVIAVILFTLLISLMAFWPEIKKGLKSISQKFSLKR